MSDKENKKSLFSGKKLPDYENTGDTISQSKNFNNTKYVKKWEMYWDTNKSTDINYTNHWKLGETVVINDNHDKFAGEKGKIALGFSKEGDMVCIELKNGKKEFIDKYYLSKISIYDYLEDK